MTHLATLKNNIRCWIGEEVPIQKENELKLKTVFSSPNTIIN
jgi:hypothetical protein